MSSQEAKIFISYSRADSDFALKLGKDLRSSGANIWIDQLDVSVSERWDQAIEAALESCASFLVILSPDSIESQNVLDEVSYALEEKKQIFPVLHTNCKIPFRIRRIHRSDFTKKYDDGYKQLVSALKIQPPVERIEQPKPETETTKAKIDRKPKRPSVYVSKPLIGAMSIVLAAVLGGYFIVKPMFDVKPPAETTFASKDVILPTDSLTMLNQKESDTTKDQPKPKKTVNTSSSDRENKETTSDIEHQQVEYFGKVLDEITKKPVQGAKVSLVIQGDLLIDYTDYEGFYRIKISSITGNLNGHVKVEANCYQTYDGFIELISKNQSIKDVRLNPSPPARISLRLKLDKIHVVHDGPGGDNEWIFEVKINDRKVLSVPKTEYDNKYADETGIYPFSFESDSFVVKDKTFELKVFGNIYKESVHVDGLAKLPSDLNGKDRLTQEVSVQSAQGQFNFFFTIMKERE